MRERDIFIEALQKDSDAERGAYLSAACESDAELRHRVEQLLAEHEKRESFFLDTPPAGLKATLDEPIRERTGTVIGPYKLLQEIGEGGMGVVFMAEQSAPVSRKVALKVIKPGMDTRQVIARFEAERQALALMDHPNIAKVLDAGTTESGRPYFVMELVKGVSITSYCDERHFTLRQRLDLFLPVCQAVQHAHQKGIIHRDLKPNNVLIAEYDNEPVPKVIDFGVAKATSQKLTERTMFTELGQVIGTVEYMSPEQAKLNQLDIDTRSDIYSLGVLLYELLTGTTPFDRTRLRAAAFDEMLRIIREEEPQKPSTKLTESKKLNSVAASRHCEPARLSKQVRGELDWIVLKCLEKERSRRYDTASALAADLQNHLQDAPVQACPPSAAYRFRKFAKRNRSALAATAAIAVSMFIALGGIAAGVGWAVRDQVAREEHLAQEQLVRQTKVSERVRLILDEVAQLEQAERWTDALISARRAESMLAAGEATPHVQDRVRETLTDLELVRRLDDIRTLSGTPWGDARGRQQSSTRADQEYTAAFRDAGADLDVHPAAQIVAWITSRRAIAAALLPALDDWVAVRSVGKDEAAARRLTDVLQRVDPDPWRQQLRNAVARRDWPALNDLIAPAELDRQPAATLSFLAAALHVSGKYSEEDFVLMRAQRKYPADFWINHRLGVDLIWRRSREQVLEGIGYMRAAVAVRPHSSHAVMNLGNGYSALGQHDDAIACCQKALELSPDYWNCLSNMGISLSRKGAYQQAITAFEQAIHLSNERAAEACTELSLIHSSRPDLRLRDARRAAELASKAVELQPHLSNHRTALGIAHFRRNHWLEAKTALEKSLQLGTHGLSGASGLPEAANWFFLAMANWHLGQKDLSQRCYERALQSIANDPIVDERLLGFQAEVEELLQITASSGGPAERRLALAHQYNNRGMAMVSTKRLPEGEALMRTALNLKQQLVVESPDNGEYKFHLAHSYLGLGHILQDLHRRPEAMQAFTDAGTILNEIIANTAATGDLQDGAAHTLWQLGDAWSRLQRFGDSEQAYKKGLVTLERLATSNPAKRSYSQQQIAGYRKLADLMLASGRTEDAEAHYQRVLDLKEKLASDTPQDASFRSELAGTLAYLGLALERDKRHLAAEEAYQHAIALWKELSDDYPDDERYRRERAYFSLGVARLLQSAGRTQDAVEQCRTSVRLHEKLAVEFAENPDYRPRLAHGRGVLISLLSSLGREEEVGKEVEALLNASPSADELRDIVRALCRSNLSTGTDRAAVKLAQRAIEINRNSGHVWTTLGIAHYRAGDWPATIESLERSRALNKDQHFSSEGFFLAMAHWQLGSKDEARKWFNQAAEWMEKNAKDDEELGRFRAEAEELMIED